VVISFETNDLAVFEVNVVVQMVDMTCNFGFGQNLSLPSFVLRNLNDLFVWP